MYIAAGLFWNISVDLSKLYSLFFIFVIRLDGTDLNTPLKKKKKKKQADLIVAVYVSLNAPPVHLVDDCYGSDMSKELITESEKGERRKRKTFTSLK